MRDGAVLLRILQEGDSFFPSGSVSFSWGLETLSSDGMIKNEAAVEAFLTAQLRNRWANFDRIVIFETAGACNMPERIAAADRLVEAQTLPEELRVGSRRTGNALLSVHAKLGTPGAKDYLKRVRDCEGLGHLSVMQGFLWASRGIAAEEAALLSAHVLCVGLLGAAVRIGIIGHVGAQKILSQVQPTIRCLATAERLNLDDIHCFLPQAEIASMRHEIATTRLFAN